MTRYSFVIDQTRCIGCHACTVACKMENEVPLGVFRTWVKYIERGEFPQVRRFYAVLRCNHCDDAPCVEICPTSALYKRSDGIVDFDNGRCIGCKACMQACPYDALYIDPETNTAAKCHFCAHRVDNGLEPACVIVCPTQAILWGDLDDPDSIVSKALRENSLTVRKPEQKTKPKLFYIGADQTLLNPLSSESEQAYLWADKTDGGVVSGHAIPVKSKVAYDISHPKPWGAKISTYLWTKSISAGIMLMLSLLTIITPQFIDIILGDITKLILLSFFFLAVTGYFLVADLKQPMRFIYVFLKPNLSSWLVKGAFIISIFGLLTLLWLIIPGNAILAYVTAPIAALAAGYSAFLFAQAEGRDFWQSPSSFMHFIFAAVQAGSASMIIALPYAPNLTQTLVVFLIISNIILAILALAEVFQRHSTIEAELSAKYMTMDRGAYYFWILFIGLGVVASTLLGAAYLANPQMQAYGLIASVAALIGLYAYEHVWVEAGQVPPLS
ncbi:MAG TPA: 4Fe-4S dicluster domain-containing protein [Candidatus Caldiarchaeum subterraneum]|uniref:4Fe-4S dicluster domain-containing protein n=1 Tax=Caldiarchaeum subterraneum TaxID=311458 RepID=A0A832ZWI3_CALS0|nr:4Fe-4S dicluster domain-containing protein [Candidatus Caldarchaeum subterraneum]